MRVARVLTVGLAIAVAIVCIAHRSRAQGGSDVGGQPARRKVTKLPRLTRFVEAESPRPVEAAVILTLDISATGAVTKVAVALSGGEDFDAAAVAAASEFVFEPAEVDDRPAPSRVTYRYAFVLKPVASPPPPSSSLPSSSLPSSSLPSSSSPSSSPSSPPSSPPSPSPPPLSPLGPAPSPDTIEVRGRPRARRETNQTTVVAEQARKVAGTQGDVLKVVQNLPGVSRPPVASGQIVVWGSAPRDTRIYVDGVDIPALYHGSGLRSVISSDLVSSIDLVPGAFGAEYGRGLGGLVRVETRAIPRGTHAALGADTLDGSALVSTELGPRARIAVAARQGWLDRVLSVTSAPDIGDFFPIPRYRDGQVKATVDLRRGEAIDAVLLGATDDLTRSVPSPDPASTRSEASHSGFWRAYLRYTNVADNGDTAILAPFVGRDVSSLQQRFGEAPARLDLDSTRYGVRGSLRTRLGRIVTLTTGADVLATGSSIVRAGSLSLPPREGDVAVFGQPPGDELAADTWRTSIVDVGPHAHADVKLGPLTVTPGLRFDAYLVEGSRRTPKVGLTPEIGFSRLEGALEPRLSARWQVGPRLALSAAYGAYHQAPEPEDLSPVFGTPDLALSRATHVTVGETLRITDALSAEVVGFQKSLQDLVVRSRLTNPLLARALTQNGEGRSYGVQLLLRQELWSGFFGWVSYAITKSERRYDGDESWRAFDFDQPHVLSVVASQEVGRWSFGARFRYASGNPRTPVVGSTFDARHDRYDPVFGAQNSLRIPAFWQVDLRVERAFSLGTVARLLLFADVQNVTNRENAEEIVYSASFRERSTIKGLPTVAVVGARLEL